MTSNPRGLEVANTVLDLMTSEVKNNINLHGYYLKTNFERMMKDFPFIEKVTGTGLLLGIHLDKNVINVLDADFLNLEQWD